VVVQLQMRVPGVFYSLQNEKTPDHLVTVFAGVDAEATKSARDMMVPFPPSSPSIALFKDGELVHMVNVIILRVAPESNC